MRYRTVDPAVSRSVSLALLAFSREINVTEILGEYCRATPGGANVGAQHFGDSFLLKPTDGNAADRVSFSLVFTDDAAPKSRLLCEWLPPLPKD